MEKEYKIQITRFAYQQMEKIRNYVVYELMAPRAAHSLLAELRKKILLLQWTPGMYALVDEEKWRKQAVRKFPVKNFLVYYWVDEERKIVHIIAVIYGRRDQLRQLELLELE